MQNAFEIELECTIVEALKKIENPINTEISSYLGDKINEFTYENIDGYTVNQMIYDYSFGNSYFFTTILLLSDNEKCNLKVFSISPDHIFTNPHKKLENLLIENMTGIKPETTIKNNDFELPEPAKKIVGSIKNILNDLVNDDNITTSENKKSEIKNEGKDNFTGIYFKDKPIAAILEKKKRDRDFKKRGL